MREPLTATVAQVSHDIGSSEAKCFAWLVFRHASGNSLDGAGMRPSWQDDHTEAYSRHTTEKKAVLHQLYGSAGTVISEEVPRERIKSEEQLHLMSFSQLSCSAPCLVGNCLNILGFSSFKHSVKLRWGREEEPEITVACIWRFPVSSDSKIISLEGLLHFLPAPKAG